MEAPKVDDADLSKWRSLWEEDGRIDVPGQGGPFGFLKRLVRRLTTRSQQDLWERQRLYNMLIQHHLEARQGQEERVGELFDLDEQRGKDLTGVYEELSKSLSSQDLRLLWVEDVQKKGLERIVEHHDAVYAVVDRKLDQYRQQTEDVRQRHEALYSVLDQKLDLYRRQALELRGQLISLLEVARSGDAAELSDAVEEQSYIELEKRHRGTEEEITQRTEPYLPFLPSEGVVLDLGCGRGEALEVFREHGLTGRGVDSNAEMVALTNEKGLDAVEGDLFDVLRETAEGSLAAVVSFHVIEHLPAGGIERLVRLAWRALAPGGVLVLETPSPLSVVVGARNFWLDPTHQRPVHPDALKLAFEYAGFEQVERIDRQPFAEDDRLHQMPTAELPDELRPLAQEINVLRDQLDSLLLGFQDFGMVGRKPAAP